MDIAIGFVVGLVSGTIGAISTGGGLISIPALIFLGLSPTSAIATTRLSALSGAVTSIYKYRQQKDAIVWRLIPIFAINAVVAGIVGSKLLLSIDDEILIKVVGAILLLLLPIIIVKKDFGTIAKQRHKRREFIGYILQFLVMIFGALFGGGTGIFLMYVMVYFFGLTFISSNATGTVAWLFVTTTAFISYALAGVVDFHVGIPLMIGASFGGYTGAHQALKKGNEWVRWIFIVLIIASAIKLLG